MTQATIYSYTVPTGGFDGVGNILSSQDSIMGNWTYQYDVLNRLLSGSASSGPDAGKNACWSYDDFGNRTIESVQTGACSGAGSVASTLVFNAQNQLSGVIPPGGGSQSPSTLLYDAAGDVTSDSHTGNQYVYDAEGRICAFQTPNGLGGTIMMGYLYDASGERVAKGMITSMNCDPASNGFTMTGTNTGTYVLGQGGEELTQLSGNGAWQRTNVFGAGKQLATYDTLGLHFQIEDALGTRRMQTNADGQPETDIQSLPYGDALITATDQYAPATADDATPLHFTGKERDTESGNDYFGARYYASSMGRWMSPDWSKTPSGVPYAILSNPQTLNLYAYVLNNPLTHFDPDGHACDSLGHCLQGFLNAIEVKVSASLGTQGSVQWGVAKAEYHATVVGVEGKSGLGGGNKDATVSTGIGASASASGGPVKASVSVNAGAQASTADGASASVSASAKVAMGPASGSASATMGTDGPSTSVGPGASADKDTDWKVGGSFTAGVGVGGDINFSQLGRAFSDAGDSLNALGSYLVDKYMPSGAPSSSGGAPGIPDPQHPF